MRLNTPPVRRAVALAVAMLLASASMAAGAPTDTSGTPAPDTVTAPTAPKPAPSAIPVPVDPRVEAFREELARRQARLAEFQAQLDVLDRELAIATEAYNLANEQLSATQERLSVTTQDLGAAQSALDEQSRILANRVEAMYRDGELNVADILLSSKSIPDFFERIQFITTIAAADAGVAGDLKAQRDQISGQELDLREAEIQARALEFALKARRIEIELRIAERESMLASAEADLAALLGSEAAARSADERALWREILSGAGRAGVVVEPGSPVETALAYHGVPYVWGGASPAGFDCSGLVMYVMKQHGVNLPHYSGSQYLLGTKVQPGDLKPGDAVFFGSPVYHVGLYVGGGYFVQAPRTGDFVKVSKLADRKDFVGARRYAWQPRVGLPRGVSATSLPAGVITAR